MDLERLKEIVRIIEKSSFTEFTLTEGENSITLKRTTAESPEQPTAESTGKNKGDNEKATEGSREEYDYIMSPMVGTFYNSPAPDAPAFVNVGDVIKTGQTICIIEAMKLMNEIDCDFEAEIVSIIVSNGQKVEYGQPLFKIRKL